MAAKFVVYGDSGGKYRWKLVSSNGQTMASSGESFAVEGQCPEGRRGGRDGRRYSRGGRGVAPRGRTRWAPGHATRPQGLLPACRDSSARRGHGAVFAGHHLTANVPPKMHW